MKSSKLIFAMIILISAASCKRNITGSPELKNGVDSISYYTGLFTAYSLKNLGDTTMNTELFYQGVKEVLSEKQSRISKAEADYNIGKGFNELRKKEGEKNLKTGRAFLAQNKTRNGVITTPSGLQYEVLNPGTGPKPKVNDMILANFKISFINGVAFINTFEKGKPDTLLFSKTSTLPGLYEAFQYMRTGSKFKIYLPSELAFGNDPPPINGLKSNMVIVYEIELIAVIPKGK